MLKFTEITKDNVIDLKKYFDQTEIEFCDISVGTRFLWRKEFKASFAIFNDTLVMTESSKENGAVFYYPIGKDVKGALSEIENYCQKNFIPLVFCYIDNAHVEEFIKRYHEVEIYNDRNWSDYIYLAENFRAYKGKKFSGQRNHVNKFKKTYTDYEFRKIVPEDNAKILEFFEKYNAENEFSSWSAEYEKENALEYLNSLEELNQVGGILLVNGSIVGLSAGEIVKETLVVHVEKALKGYSGVYPTLASEFVNLFGNNVIYINREEDCGDVGLRISKLQYKPVEVKEKNFVKVKTLFSKLASPIYIKTKRLTVTEIETRDKDDYFALYTDDELNKYWGYDYREDCENPTPDYFFEFQQKLKDRKEEYSLAIRLNDKMIGELVMHGFDYFGGVEIGFRLFREFQGKGYAQEGLNALIDYVRGALKPTVIKTRCFKQNEKSHALILRAGFTKSAETEEKYFFTKK